MRFLWLVVLCTGFGLAERSPRKKRYLTFPEGSVFTAGISQSTRMLPVLSAYLAISADSAYRLPFDAKVFYKHKGRLKKKWKKHRRQRRDIYRELEFLMDVQGLNGSACISRAVCEASQIPGPKLATNFLLEALHLIFSDPSGSTENPEGCSVFIKTCPFSLLQPISPFMNLS